MLSEQFFSRRPVRFRRVDARYGFFSEYLGQRPGPPASEELSSIVRITHLSKPRLRDLVCRSYSSISIYNSLITPVRLTNAKPDRILAPVQWTYAAGLRAIIRYMGVNSSSFAPATSMSAASARLSALFCIPLGMRPIVSPSPTNL